MDATMLAVMGTGLTTIATGLALFVALWRVQGNRFDTLERHIDHRFAGVDKQFAAVDKQFAAVDKQFAAVDKQFAAVDKQFAAVDKKWTERFEMAEKASRERFEMAENASRERLEAMDARLTQRLDTVERQGQATHAAVCALNGRFDDLYRHLLGVPAQGGPPRPAG